MVGNRPVVAWLAPLGIDNGFAIVVRGEDARRRRLESLSDAAGVSEGWRLGAGYEFEQRADGRVETEATIKIWLRDPVRKDP